MEARLEGTANEMSHRRSAAAERRRDETESARCVTTSAWPVTCEDFRAGPNHRFDVHAHEQPHVCFVVAGTLVERHGRDRRRVQAGGGRLSPAGDTHELSVGDGRRLRCLVVSIAPGALDFPDGFAPEGRRYLDGPGVAGLARRLLDELASPDDASPISLEMLGIEAAALAGVPGVPGPSRDRVGTTPPWLERVRERVRDDLRSVPTLDELARDAGVSRAHLARAFRRRYGYTIGQFVRGERLETARRLLLRTKTPLATVACEAGFADQSHMTRLVGSRFGHPPGRLRALRGTA